MKEAIQRLGVDREAEEEHRRRHARTAGEACSRPARIAAPAAKLSLAAREMLDGRISRLVVIDDGRYALQSILDEAGAQDVRVSVESGEVSGVMSVDAEGLTWREDDLMRFRRAPRS